VAQKATGLKSQLGLKMMLNKIDAEKIRLFRKIYCGRQDVVARYWESKKGRSGYSPLCKNEWKPGICKKPCRNCPNSDYKPLSDSLIKKHLKGEEVLGVYPLLKDNTCHFIAADFDNHDGNKSPLDDVKSFYEVCQVQDIPCYISRSRSGNGYHAHIFFSSLVPAWKARIVLFALLQEADVIGDNTEISSFDRLFPNQDRLSGKEFGNLIALPFQGKAAKNDHTLILDPATGFSRPYNDQWNVLSRIQKVGETELDNLIAAWNLKRKEPVRLINLDNRDAEKIALDCAFVQHCKDNSETLSEPLWLAMLSNVISIRPGGYDLCQKFSMNYPKYMRPETDQKILHAINSSAPITCEWIRQNDFKCDRPCIVNSPAGLFFLLGQHYKNISDTGDKTIGEREEEKEIKSKSID
jgi:hypothetical protein